MLYSTSGHSPHHSLISPQSSNSCSPAIWLLCVCDPETSGINHLNAFSGPEGLDPAVLLSPKQIIAIPTLAPTPMMAAYPKMSDFLLFHFYPDSVHLRQLLPSPD